MKGQIVFLFVVVPWLLYAQLNEVGAEVADTKYLEDQFYVGLSYNFIRDKPDGISQQNLSYGLQFGVIKDIPLNKTRNVALGIGVGYAVNSYYSNLFASQADNTITYAIASDSVGLRRGKLENHLIEFPLEFRWRTSTPEEYKFWRIYGGIKFGYVFSSRFKFVTNTDKIAFSNGNNTNFQYGLTLNFGYNTFNIHTYYALSALFKDGTNLGTTNTPIEFKPLRIGIIFYIL
ncbi:porin family protein [Arenibacter sp. GZD96]|uniref:porin family protein n=1 Tax=Aurantibrevibacter litoralis TaxID=3106030 RepID=UPI002AFDD9E9|nr:porin family protein [Arenibacter sp. GZD-96]MEA1784546.1 porin family protein [Arenibacter sp. GZD-96]